MHSIEKKCSEKKNLQRQKADWWLLRAMGREGEGKQK